MQAEPGQAVIRRLAKAGRYGEAWQAATAQLLCSEDGVAWSAARNVLALGRSAGWAPSSTREIRLAVLCTYEAAELREHLRLACLALGIDAAIYEAPYGQLEQEILGGDALARFAPTHVLIAPTTADLGLPELANDRDERLDRATARWLSLWEAVRTRLGARVLQHSFVVPDSSALGHLSLRLPGSRIALVRELNRRLGEAAGADVLLVDAERLAARIGKRRWEDPRLWYAARTPYGPEAMAMLARETAAVLAADLGLAARCLVVDLDNTLWGGVVGDDGVDAIVVGEGPDGEAYAAFQAYLADLAWRGVVLAVASKNDLEAAREPFRRHPGMRLGLEDFAAFVADWRPKSQQITEIAHTLGLSTASLVFADDNPAECAEVNLALPDVTTVALDVPPSERVRRLAACVRLELSALSSEDLERQHSYAARVRAGELQASSTSLDGFWRSLEMRARVAPLASGTLDRASQLTQKTNQFNLTLRRHTREQIEQLAQRADAICLTLELEDRFARHGLVGLGLVVGSDEDPDTATIDTLLLSCRVIGRTAEVHLLSHLSREALARGFTRLQGIYVPGPRNGLVADLYPTLGFAPCDADAHRWEYDLRDGPIESLYIADFP